jgi:hypothetical protein
VLFRCPDCRTRRKDYGLFTRHLRESGHGACDCGGYHYRHRPGAPYCDRNPWSDYLAAKRRGEDQAVLDEIEMEKVWSGEGLLPGGAEPPF